MKHLQAILTFVVVLLAVFAAADRLMKKYFERRGWFEEKFGPLPPAVSKPVP